MLLPVNDWLYFECFSMRLCCNSQRRALIASSFVVWDAFCGVLAGMTLHAPLCCYVTNVFWSVAARTPSSIRYSSFAVPFIFSIFGISRQTDIHICDCSCKVIEFFEFFWTAVDFDLRFPAHLRVFVRRHMQTYTKCVRLRFARTHLSRSEVLVCLQLSYCFATIHR